MGQHSPAAESRYADHPAGWHPTEPVRHDEPHSSGCVERLEHRLATDRQLLALMADGAELHDVLDLIARKVEEECQQLLWCSILLYDPTAQVLNLGAGPSLPEGVRLSSHNIPIGPTHGSCGASVFHRRPVICEDVDKHPNWRPFREFARAHGIRASWSTPLISGGNVLGTFALYLPVSRGPTEEEFQLVEHYGYLARTAIEYAAARQQLLDSEQRLASLLQTAPDGILVLNSQGQIVMFNEAAGKIFGCSPWEVLGQSFELLGGPAWCELIRNIIRNPHQTPERPRELQAVHATGRPFPVEISYSTRLLSQGWFVTLIVRDITERKRMEELLLQSQRMEMIGRTAACVAHDFNNLLTVIVGLSNISRQGLSAGHPLAQALREIQHAGEHAAQLVRQLLNFHRLGPTQRMRTDISYLIRRMQGLLRRVLGEAITLECHLHPALPEVFLDPQRFEQLLLNLITNARDAMPRGGRVTLITELVDYGVHPPPKHGEYPPGRYVLLRVRDKGPGIPDELKLRVFEPFFTTKPTDQGHGLGLAIVYQIVNESGGLIEVVDAPGGGAEFQLSWPACVDGPSPQNYPTPAVEESDHPGGTVLVVEDDDSVRLLTCRILEGWGYRVFEAASAREARQLFTKMRPLLPIQAVLCDVVLPDAYGSELVHDLRREQPSLGVLYMSGHPLETLEKYGVDPQHELFLQKPFWPASLSLAIKQAIIRPQATLPPSAAVTTEDPQRTTQPVAGSSTM